MKCYGNPCCCAESVIVTLYIICDTIKVAHVYPFSQVVVGEVWLYAVMMDLPLLSCIHVYLRTYVLEVYACFIPCRIYTHHKLYLYLDPDVLYIRGNLGWHSEMFNVQRVYHTYSKDAHHLLISVPYTA